MPQLLLLLALGVVWGQREYYVVHRPSNNAYHNLRLVEWILVGALLSLPYVEAVAPKDPVVTFASVVLFWISYEVTTRLLFEGKLEYPSPFYVGGVAIHLDKWILAFAALGAGILLAWRTGIL